MFPNSFLITISEMKILVSLNFVPINKATLKNVFTYIYLYSYTKRNRN